MSPLGRLACGRYNGMRIGLRIAFGIESGEEFRAEFGNTCVAVFFADGGAFGDDGGELGIEAGAAFFGE